MASRFIPAALAAIALAACAAPAMIQSGDLVTGGYGGPHIGLSLDAAGGRLEYDCASGTIDGPLTTDSLGRFSSTGRHTPGEGGPDRAGDAPRSYPARYLGQARGDILTLRVEVEGAASPGSFRLARGAEPRLLRCL